MPNQVPRPGNNRSKRVSHKVTRKEESKEFNQKGSSENERIIPMKIVAVCACTAGIAHTYMAQEAIEQECAKRGIECKVETQGGMGIDNEIEQDEVDEADVAILAVAVGIEMEDRFDEKRDEGKLIEVDPSVAIKQTAELIDEAVALAE